MAKRATTVRYTMTRRVSGTCLAICMQGLLMGCRTHCVKPQPRGFSSARRTPRARDSHALAPGREHCRSDRAINAAFSNPTQEELDTWDCLCALGHPRCCVALGEFIGSSRVKGLSDAKNLEQSHLAGRYYLKACHLGSGVGCLEAAPRLGKEKSRDYGEALADAKRECEHGDTLACFSAASEAHTGLETGVVNKALARRLADRGCNQGGRSSCSYIADHLSRDDWESERYFLRECENGVMDVAKEQACQEAALFSFQIRYRKVEARDAERHPMYLRVAFDSLVIFCAVRFKEPWLCDDVVQLCRTKNFRSKNKRRFCPLVEKARQSYVLARRQGRRWPPAIERRGYLRPSCARVGKSPAHCKSQVPHRG